MQNPTWLQRDEHFGTAGGDSSSRGLFNTTMSVNAIKSRQAATSANQNVQQQQQQQNGHFAVLRVRPGGNNIHPSNKSAIITNTSPPQRATPEGIAIGTLSTAVFHCNNDPMVSPEHGTLECTSKHGIWVYVDHSVHGTKLNSSRRIHKEAVVVRTGDRLLVGNTEIELHFETSSGDDAQRQNDVPSKHLGGRQHAQAQGNNNNLAGVAPSPITWPPASSEGTRKSDHFKMEKPKIVTSGDSFAAPTPLEYISSPIPPGAYSRRKRHSMTAFTPSSPGGGGGGVGGANPFIYHRTRPLVPSAPSTPPRLDATRPCTAVNISPHQPHGIMKWGTSQPEDDNNNNNNSHNNDSEDTPISSSRNAKPGKFTSTPPPPPPPLSYSSSPVTAPSLVQCMQQQQHQKPHLPQSPSPPLVPQQQPQHQRLHTEAPKSSQRDNLRIQVSKKMAGYQAAVESKRAGGKLNISSGGRPILGNLKIPLPSTPPHSIPSSKHSNSNQLDFTPPSSPVAHKDILRQKESLLNILKNKYKEEQLLKQQQEEWMRHNFNLASPPISPIKSSRHKLSAHGDGDDQSATKEDDKDDDEDMSDLEIPSHAPVLLRTISLGIHQASPRLTAAVLASRARVNSFEDKKRSNQQRSPGTVNTNASQESADFSSVSSSVSTELACHRRVTRSLSISSSEDLVSSADISEFMGYEEEVGDDMTSFTTHGFYSSDDCKSNPKDDSMRQFSSSSSSLYYTSASSSSLKSGGGGDVPPSHHDRYSIDIMTSREPEDDDEVQESPKKSSRVDSTNSSAHVMRKAESTPNLFSDTQRSPPVYKSVVRRYSRVKGPSPIEVSGGGDSASSPEVARRFRRLPSPV